MQRQEEEEEDTLLAKPLAGQITPLVQRQVDPEAEEPIQTKRSNGSTLQVSPSLATQIRSLRGGGQSLPRSVRSFFEPRFGYNFTQVRVHTDAGAEEIARALNARALTVGHNVLFGAGQYAPGTTAGKKLLAHELTHVVQQGLVHQQGLRQFAINTESRGVSSRGTIVKLSKESIFLALASGSTTKKRGNKQTHSVLSAFLLKHEGYANHMYVDQKGKVHTGIGFNIDSIECALRYRWLRNSDNKRATQDEVKKEWNRIHALAPKYSGTGARKIKRHTTLHLTNAEIMKKFMQKARRRQRSLKTIFPSFGAFPADAQLAMQIHAWAIEPVKLLADWPEYTAACRKRNWKVAAAQAHWRNMKPERYEGMKVMFNNAAIIEEAIKKGLKKYNLSKVYYPVALKKN